MPQVILDYSANIIEKNHLTDLLKKINVLLSEQLPTDLSACKSRAMKQDIFCVGEDDSASAFVHINLKIMPGRDIEKLNNLGNTILSILKDYFHQSAEQFKLQLTLEIEEIQKTYFKYAAG